MFCPGGRNRCQILRKTILPGTGGKCPRNLCFACGCFKQIRKSRSCRIHFKNREHLCTLQPEGDVLILNQMRYQSEIRELKELKIPKSTESKENELKLALQLIDTMTEKFDPPDFKDDYIGALKKLIEAKARHKTYKVAEAGSPKLTEI